MIQKKKKRSTRTLHIRIKKMTEQKPWLWGVWKCGERISPKLCHFFHSIFGLLLLFNFSSHFVQTSIAIANAMAKGKAYRWRGNARRSPQKSPAQSRKLQWILLLDHDWWKHRGKKEKHRQALSRSIIVPLIKTTKGSQSLPWEESLCAHSTEL
jgi:hypothetical protein